MLLFIFNLALAIFIPLAVFFAAWVLSARSSSDREKSSPFECGFDPKNSARLPFSLRFFLLAVIFLVFDIEIALLMPIPLLMINNLPAISIIIAFSFFMILLLGLLHEWHEGSLDWST
uniref:NADH-ubiquinone oxidoreductase chain 3 n=1 Tax=Melinna cristata TaxID=222004 RepID=A0A8A4VSV4_9ANNE|nr:NADH dehydrogenase subunit 3 [Melinna cristata]QTD82977.1 NADH dehydrogenase subunit 3 [Melinna cristata]